MNDEIPRRGTEGAWHDFGLTRREMLGRLGAGFGFLSLAGLLGGAQAAVRATGASPGGGWHHPARAKRVIFLFLNGGPSHVDTFDPKPALREHEGKQPEGKLYKASKGSGFMPSPFAFSRHGQSGIEVSETMPHLAQVIDDCCIIRSMRTDVPNHEPALLQMHTGNLQPIRPSLGSWLLYGLGSENENLPGYVVLRPSPKIVVGPALWSNSFLPGEFQATSVITADPRVDKMLGNIHNPRWNRATQRRQLDLVQQLNREHQRQRPGAEELEAQIRAMETAFQMQREATEVFDLEKEPAPVRALYGDTPFARSCLLARRLVEAGVRFVSVYYTSDGNNQPWDTHSAHNQQHPKLCEDGDRAAAALITDLKARGLLSETLVIWGGEFGRTPYAENRENQKAGRDHHHTAFSMLLAGGGVKAGMVYGATDEFGMHVVENPVHVHDFHATILHLLGLDHERLTFHYGGRDFRLTDVAGHVATGVIG